MTDLRVTQVALEALEEVEADLRVTQIVIEALEEIAAPLRVTQVVIEALVETHPCAASVALCWIIRRLDGVTLGFTSLDEALDVDGVTCSPCASLAGGAIETASSAGAIGDQGVVGLLDDDAISEADLLAGVYDGATVEVWRRPYGEDAASIAPRLLLRGTIGRVVKGEATFTADLVTAAARLAQTPLIPVHAAGCRWTQYDARCGLDRDAHKVAGAVTGLAPKDAANAQERRVFFDAARGEASGFFDAGLLSWTSGANIGLSSEVKEWDAALKRFVLWDPLPRAIGVGDAYEVAPSCRNTEDGCKSFSNFVNYGGFPKIPGRDLLIRTPDHKE